MPYSTSRRTALALSRVFLPPPLLRLLPFLALYSIHLRGEPQADYNSSSLPRRPCPPPANLATHHCFVLSRPRSSTVRPPVSCWHPPAPPDAVPERGQLLRRTSSSSTLIDARSAYFNYLFFFWLRCLRPLLTRPPVFEGPWSLHLAVLLDLDHRLSFTLRRSRSTQYRPRLVSFDKHLPRHLAFSRRNLPACRSRILARLGARPFLLPSRDPIHRPARRLYPTALHLHTYIHI